MIQAEEFQRACEEVSRGVVVDFWARLGEPLEFMEGATEYHRVPMWLYVDIAAGYLPAETALRFLNSYRDGVKITRKDISTEAERRKSKWINSVRREGQAIRTARKARKSKR